MEIEIGVEMWMGLVVGDVSVVRIKIKIRK